MWAVSISFAQWEIYKSMIHRTLHGGSGNRTAGTPVTVIAHSTVVPNRAITTIIIVTVVVVGG